MIEQTRPNTHRQAVVIGIGNEFRHDDAAGLLVVRQLRKQCHMGNLRFVESDGNMTDLFTAWEGCQLAFLIDAVVTEAPQDFLRIDAINDPIPRHVSMSSSHSFSVAEVIALARSLNQLPEQLVIYGIRGTGFSIGMGLSAGVGNAVHCVVDWIASELAVWETARQSAAP